MNKRHDGIDASAPLLLGHMSLEVWILRSFPRPPETEETLFSHWKAGLLMHTASMNTLFHLHPLCWHICTSYVTPALSPFVQLNKKNHSKRCYTNNKISAVFFCLDLSFSWFWIHVSPFLLCFLLLNPQVWCPFCAYRRRQREMENMVAVAWGRLIQVWRQ